MIVYLAGEAYGKRVFEDADYKFNRLDSFWYVKDNEHGRQSIPKYDRYILDSGAFTFIMSKSDMGVDIDSFTDQYIDFINEHKIDLFFEMDVDAVFGYDKVLQLRKRIEKGTGKQCIPVYHMDRGIEDWRRMCDEYDYVSIGIAGKDVGWADAKAFYRFVNDAANKGVKVHGLGITGMRSLKEVPFHSVDSSAWTAGNRYKTIFHFDGTQCRSLQKDLSDLVIHDQFALAKHNFTQWNLFSKSMESKRLV